MNKIKLNIILLVKIPIDAGYSALTDEVESSHKTPKFKVGDKVRITKYKSLLQRLQKKLVEGNICDWFCVEN